MRLRAIALRRQAAIRRAKLVILLRIRRAALNVQKKRLAVLARRTIALKLAFRHVRKYTVQWYYYMVRWYVVSLAKFYVNYVYYQRIKNVRLAKLWHVKWSSIRRMVMTYRKRLAAKKVWMAKRAARMRALRIRAARLRAARLRALRLARARALRARRLAIMRARRAAAARRRAARLAKARAAAKRRAYLHAMALRRLAAIAKAHARMIMLRLAARRRAAARARRLAAIRAARHR